MGLAIPTYNAGREFEKVLKKVKSQSVNLDLIKIYDSGSFDETLEIAKKYKVEVEIISKATFSHSGTRTMIAKQMLDLGMSHLIFITQDVFLQENAIENLIHYIVSNPNCGVAYGKQEVDLKIGTIYEYFARSFNYGDKDLIKSKHDIEKLGIKTIFNSDAFAIYNLKLSKEVGFFGDKVNFSEDMLIADRFIQVGYDVGYSSNAKVFHTHGYTIFEEYKRYKSIGKFHREQKIIIGRYGKTNSEGFKLAINELKYLISKGEFYRLPESIIRNIVKFLGMKIGYYLHGIRG